MSPTPSPDLFPQHSPAKARKPFRSESRPTVERLEGGGTRFGPPVLGVRKPANRRKAATPADQRRLDALIEQLEKCTKMCAFHHGRSHDDYIAWSRRFDSAMYHVERGELAGRW